MYHFCTITTSSHLFKVYALAESLKNQGATFMLHVLVTDNQQPLQFDNCHFLYLKDIESATSANTIITKYENERDKMRWALKPVLMKWLLQQDEINTVIYLDNDIFFFSNYSFLFDLLKDHAFTLTPHYYKTDPLKEQNWLEANFRVGMFNAGFVGANKTGIETLQWWADCCAYRCEKNSFRGLFDDQKYLDLVPVMEETAFIIRHKGCNLSGWNTELCKREMINGEVKIEGKYPVVFIHFNDITIRKILDGEDALLAPHYRIYEEILKKYKPGLSGNELLRPNPVQDKLKLKVWQLLNMISN